MYTYKVYIIKIGCKYTDTKTLESNWKNTHNNKKSSTTKQSIKRVKKKSHNNDEGKIKEESLYYNRKPILREYVIMKQNIELPEHHGQKWSSIRVTQKVKEEIYYFMF